MGVNLRALVGKLNSTTRGVLEGAAGLTLARTHYAIELEHFLAKLVDADGSDFNLLAARFEMDRARLASDLERALERMRRGNSGSPSFGPQLLDALAYGWLYGSLEFSASSVRTGHVVLALIAEGQFAQALAGISPEFRKLDADRLRRDFATLIHGSSEEDGWARTEEERREGPNVFICYRREDSALYANLLFTSIRARVPDVRVFRDSETLEPGMVFTERIPETIGKCDVILAVIGKEWLASSAAGTRRIDEPEDWVRLEIATALDQKKLVIPCLVGGAAMPRQTELPADIAGLAWRHALSVSDAEPERDIDRVVAQLMNWRSAR